MKCVDTRELLSARFDGELSTAESEQLAAHLRGCQDCRLHETDLSTMHMRLNASAELASIPIPKQPFLVDVRAASALQATLFVVGGTLIALNAPNLVWGGDVGDAHLTKHDAVFGSALGIAMVAVAFRPQRSMGLVTITSTIAVLMGVVAVVDIVDGQRTMLAEAVHVLEFVGLVCLWVISGGVSRLSNRMSNRLSINRPGLGSSVVEWPTG